jgi:pimeloyl-ACP methyl ester carboxylesterase
VLQAFADGRLFGSRTGDGTPRVLALHGWGRSHRDFDGVLRPATGDPPLDALAVDLPGFGASPPPPAPWGPAEYADCVAAVLPEMSPPVVILGHSFGGRVAVHLAASRPEQVAALVLAAVPLVRVTPRRRPPAPYRVLHALRRAGVVSESRMERARQRYGSADYRAASGVMRQVLVGAVGGSDEHELDAVRCPVTLVWADDDAAVPLAVARAALARLEAGPAGGSSELVVLPGAGHLLPSTAPRQLRGALERRLG